MRDTNWVSFAEKSAVMRGRSDGHSDILDCFLVIQIHYRSCNQGHHYLSDLIIYRCQNCIPDAGRPTSLLGQATGIPPTELESTAGPVGLGKLSRLSVAPSKVCGGCQNVGSSHTEPEEVRLEPYRVLLLSILRQTTRSRSSIRGAFGVPSVKLPSSAPPPGAAACFQGAFSDPFS